MPVIGTSGAFWAPSTQKWNELHPFLSVYFLLMMIRTLELKLRAFWFVVVAAAAA